MPAAAVYPVSMTGTTPRRRQSPAVYRRRRIVLLVGLLVIAGVIWLLIAQPWAGAADEKATNDDTSTKQNQTQSLPVPSSGATDAAGSTGGATDGAGTPTPGATPTALPCVASDIAVQAVTSADTYSGDDSPQFTIKLTNNGPDCTLNVGTSGQSFTVTSGDDVWWRSTDCQSEPSDMIVTIAAGQTVSSAAPLAWDRTRSAVGTCADETRPRAPGGGASYNLSVEIGGIPSTQPKQFLLY
jgi:cytoskeletal protein RodZ